MKSSITCLQRTSVTFDPLSMNMSIMTAIKDRRQHIYPNDLSLEFKSHWNYTTTSTHKVTHVCLKYQYCIVVPIFTALIFCSNTILTFCLFISGCYQSEDFVFFFLAIKLKMNSFGQLSGNTRLSLKMHNKQARAMANR